MTDWPAYRGTHERRIYHKFERRHSLDDALLCGRLSDGHPCGEALAWVRLDAGGREMVTFEPGVFLDDDGIYDLHEKDKRRLRSGGRLGIPKDDRRQYGEVQVFKAITLPARRRCPTCGAIGSLRPLDWQATSGTI